MLPGKSGRLDAKNYAADQGRAAGRGKPVGEEFLTYEDLGCVSPRRGREEAKCALWWQGACLEKARGALCGRKSYARCWGLCHTSYEKPLESARLLCKVKKCL